jgi:two-component sensor histidine kinase
VVEQNTDVSDRVRAEQHRQLLARELDHRVKNTLAVVQGLARLTFGRSEQEKLRVFDERLRALSEAHNALLRESWTHADLRELVEDVLGALNVEGRVSLDGPPAILAPTSAMAYALAFHELATNAIKHGALSTPQGRVALSWDVYGDTADKLRVVWREIGGPLVAPPSQEGFGTRLIRRAVAAELGTPVDLRFEPTGLVCEFDGALQKSPMRAISSAEVLADSVAAKRGGGAP